MATASGSATDADGCRLAERAVSFTQVWQTAEGQAWDHHNNIEAGFNATVRPVGNQPLRRVLVHLNTRHVDSTLVLWGGGGSFWPHSPGELPAARWTDHNHYGISRLWMAGGGSEGRPGPWSDRMIFGFAATENRRPRFQNITPTDAHLMGPSQRKLTYQYGRT